MMRKGRNSAKEVKMERKIIQKVREKETVKVTLIAFAKKPFSLVKSSFPGIKTNIELIIIVILNTRHKK